MRALMQSPLIQLVLRFGLSGGLSTALHWGLMALLIHLQLVAPELATATGALAGAVLNYFLQYHFTFKTRREHRLAVPAYIIVASLSWVLNLGLFWLLHGVLDIRPVLAQLTTTAIVTLINFILYKRVVFHERTQSQATT